jgi:Flp pilus assembly protein TadD
MALEAKEKVPTSISLSYSSLNGMYQGNAAFKTGDFPAAIGHYTTAILADPKDISFPLNRAAAYLKLGKCVFSKKGPLTLLIRASI